MKLFRWTYQRQFAAYFAAAFIAFAIVLIIFQLETEKQNRKQLLLNNLSGYVGILARSDDYGTLRELLPEDLSVTVTDSVGNVIYDSQYPEIAGENRESRPEIENALRDGAAFSIRDSGTSGTKHLYYSEVSGDRVIRVALPFESEVQQFIRPMSIYLLVVGLLFGASLLLIVILSNRFSQSIIRLLQLHIQNSDKAVAIFSPKRVMQYSNSKFTQYLSAILGRPVTDAGIIWKEDFFAPVAAFQKEHADCSVYEHFKYVKEVAGKKYKVRMLIYPETGFEISIADITEAQNSVILKQQMTSNISHELRTPVTSIMGYLETLSTCPNMDESKRKTFIDRAYNQCKRLSGLIRDMAMISKIEESSERLVKEPVELKALSDEVFGEFAADIEKKHITVENLLEDDLEVNGNVTLLHAIFRNMVENSLKYAGEGVTLHLECYSAEDDHVYLTYYDTGNGVPPEHLTRLFERFYRVTEGRTRDDGGSGLGLSIVRNAVAFHDGDIRAVNREEGGLQFFFSLHC